MMVAVLILVKSRPPPTNRKPRLLLARNRPFRVSVFCCRTLRQEMKATMPVKNRKLAMVSTFIECLQRVPAHEPGWDGLFHLFTAHDRLPRSFSHQREIGGDSGDAD